MVRIGAGRPSKGAPITLRNSEVTIEFCHHPRMTAPIPAAKRHESFMRFAAILIGWVAFWMAVSYLGHSVKPETAEAPVTANSVTASGLTTYVNDFAGALEPATRERLNASLQQLEKETSNQLAAAIYVQLPDRKSTRLNSSHG